MGYAPLAVGLKFGFLAVLYLFLLWVARSALKDLRRTASPAPDATGFHPVVRGEEGAEDTEQAWLVAERGGGIEEGTRFDVFGGASIGRSPTSDVTIEDRYASSVHARVYARRGHYYLEDMNSTNGTLLNDQQLDGEAELLEGDLIRIGDTEFRFDTGG